MPFGPKIKSRLYAQIPLELRKDWRWQVKHLIRTPEELASFLGTPSLHTSVYSVSSTMWVTPYYADLIDPGDPHDPLLKQILPLMIEEMETPGTSMDPLEEAAHSPVKGLIHRYPDRALLLLTGFCPTLCRFCMRKRAWSADHEGFDFNLDEVLDYIRAHEEIHDVILSGGDPLMLPLSRLETLLHGLRDISHVYIIRIGSRAPVTLPQRIRSDVTDLLESFTPLWLLTHFNHPREITDEAREGLSRLVGSGVIINNQSVLLRGVNDSTETLTTLSLQLLKAGVRPYYLHQVDYVKGISHFRVPLEEGIGIVKAMFGRISGLGIPRYILDLPGGKGKVPIMPSFMESETKTNWIFKGPLGGQVNLSRRENA